MDIDIELWDNKTITSGLKNYLRWAGFAPGMLAARGRAPWLGGRLATLCVRVSITPVRFLHRSWKGQGGKVSVQRSGT